MKGPTLDSTVKKFLKAVKKGKNVKELKERLHSSPKDQLRTWKDADSMDLLHHTIMLNHPKAVELLVLEGYFWAPYQSTVNMYPHFTCKLGYSEVLSVLLQYRPHEIHLKGNVILSRNSKELSKSQEAKKSVKQFPLDIAGDENKIGCVRTILDMEEFKNNPDASFKGYVVRACLANSASALWLLVQKNETLDPNMIKYCVDICLKRAQPECLAILLYLKIDLSSLFSNINFFHMLYTYSDDLYSSEIEYCLLPKLTLVLIENGHSVNAVSPPRTYPIYSLLSRAFCNYKFIRHYIKCFEILLSNGANPCFDEVTFEKTTAKQDIQPVTGRESFLSALHCLLQNIEGYAKCFESRTLAVNFILECGDLLGHFKGCFKHVGHGKRSRCLMKGNILNQYAKSCVVSGVDMDIIRWMLRHGANPNEKQGEHYAINIYLNTLCEKLATSDKSSNETKFIKDVEVMLTICDYMNFDSLREARHIIEGKSKKQISESAHPYVLIVEKELQRRSKEIKSLRRLSSWVVWRQCSMSTENVGSLKISATISKDIIPFLETLSF